MSWPGVITYSNLLDIVAVFVSSFTRLTIMRDWKQLTSLRVVVFTVRMLYHWQPALEEWFSFISWIVKPIART
jgi:hypothetical protein